jgi:hypothetical protein
MAAGGPTVSYPFSPSSRFGPQARISVPGTWGSCLGTLARSLASRLLRMTDPDEKISVENAAAMQLAKGHNLMSS